MANEKEHSVITENNVVSFLHKFLKTEDRSNLLLFEVLTGVYRKEKGEPVEVDDYLNERKYFVNNHAVILASVKNCADFLENIEKAGGDGETLDSYDLGVKNLSYNPFGKYYQRILE